MDKITFCYFLFISVPPIHKPTVLKKEETERKERSGQLSCPEYDTHHEATHLILIER